MFCGYRTLWGHFGLVRFLGRSRRSSPKSPAGVSRKSLDGVPRKVPPEFHEKVSPEFHEKVSPETLKKSRRRPESLLGGRTSLEQKPYPFAVTRNADAIRRNRIASRSCSSGEVIAYSRRYRGEYAGAARPRLRQRDIVSLDSLHVIRGVGALCAGEHGADTQRHSGTAGT